MSFEFKPIHAVIALAVGAVLAVITREQSPALEPSRTDESSTAPNESAAKRVATTVEVIRVVERPRRKRSARKSVQPVAVEPVAEPVGAPVVADPNPNPES